MEKKKLGEILVEEGVITPAQLEEALSKQKESGKRLGKVLVSMGIASENNVAEALALKLGIPFVDLSSLVIDPEVVNLIPSSLAQKNLLIPMEKAERKLIVAMVDPLDLNAISDVQFRTGLIVERAVATESDILDSIDKYYHLDEAVYDMFKNILPGEKVEVFPEIKEGEKDLDQLKKVSEAPTIIRLVDTIFADAVKMRASDIHVEPQERTVFIRYRIDGMLKNILKIPKHIQASLTSRIKIISNMDITEKRKPQDGRTKMRIGSSHFDMRVSALPTLYGEKIVIRILEKKQTGVILADLGLSSEILRLFESLLFRPQGILLVTGPTGSGKTTTLYAALNKIRSETKNIITVEDPIEYQIEGINQVQVNEKAGVTFANGLRSILRQDPNVIMIGEIRDRETAEIAFQAAQTGHLVLSTLHTNDAASAVIRLIDIGIEPFLITSSVIGVLAQRLARRICPDCKETTTVDLSSLAYLNLNIPPGASFYRGKGCEKCKYTGFLGRIGAYELLSPDERIRNLIKIGVSDKEILAAARLTGMKTMMEDGLEKALKGITSLDEVLRIVPPLEPDSGRSVVQPFSPPIQAWEEKIEPRGIRKEKILVVDDSPTILDMLKHILESENYEVITASDGMEGIEKVYRESPDLIVSDVMMPRLDGFGMVKKLKEHLDTSFIPIVMLTSQDEVESEVRGLEVGADDYIAKPIEPKRLLARVKRTIQRSQVKK